MSSEKLSNEEEQLLERLFPDETERGNYGKSLMEIPISVRKYIFKKVLSVESSKQSKELVEQITEYLEGPYIIGHLVDENRNLIRRTDHFLNENQFLKPDTPLENMYVERATPSLFDLIKPIDHIDCLVGTPLSNEEEQLLERLFPFERERGNYRKSLMKIPISERKYIFKKVLSVDSSNQSKELIEQITKYLENPYKIVDENLFNNLINEPVASLNPLFDKNRFNNLINLDPLLFEAPRAKYCARCSSKLVGKYFILKNPAGSSSDLCRSCVRKAQLRLRMLSAKPDKEVKKLIRSAWNDLKRAAHFDPDDAQIKDNMKAVRPLLKTGKGSPVRYCLFWAPLWGIVRALGFPGLILFAAALLTGVAYGTTIVLKNMDVNIPYISKFAKPSTHNSRDKLKTISEPLIVYHVQATEVTVRKGPGKNFPVVTSLPKGTKVIEKSHKGTWIYAEVPGTNYNGWINVSLLKRQKAENEVSGLPL